MKPYALLMFIFCTIFYSPLFGGECVGEMECTGGQTITCSLSFANMSNCEVIPYTMTLICNAFDNQGRLLGSDTQMCINPLGGNPIGSTNPFGDDDLVVANITTLDDLLCYLYAICHI